MSSGLLFNELVNKISILFLYSLIFLQVLRRFLWRVFLIRHCNILDNYLRNYTIDESILKKYGFANKNGEYILEYDLPIKNLFALVKITKSSFSVRVIDREFNDDFLPFSVKDGNSPVKAMVDDLVSDIVKKCFTNLKLDVIRYCEETYKTSMKNRGASIRSFVHSKLLTLKSGMPL